jgi:3-oxoacyl-[acyl-carrier protein] reductase
VNISGLKVVITGAGRGLGRSMALDLAQRGARLTLLDLQHEPLAVTAGECRARSAEVITRSFDVSDEAQVEATFADIASEMGGIDALVNNAGILRDGLLVKGQQGQVEKKLSLADWQAVIDVNLTGVFLCGREAAVQMVRQGRGGCIINLSSISRAGNFGQSNYSAAKAGVAALSVTWAKELARHGIRCMAIAPGFISTEMTAGMPEQALARALSQVPLGRPGEPQEVALAVVQVLENDYLTGRVIELDGGMRI